MAINSTTTIPTISPASPTKYGQVFDITSLTVDAGSSVPLSSGNVQFSVDYTAEHHGSLLLGTSAITGAGHATRTISLAQIIELHLDVLLNDNYTIRARFDDIDTNYNPSSGTKIHQIAAATFGLSNLASDRNPAAYHQSVNFSVSGSLNYADYNVGAFNVLPSTQFKSDGSLLGTVGHTNGVYTYSSGGYLSIGSHAITASGNDYSSLRNESQPTIGPDVFGGTQISGLTQVINKISFSMSTPVANINPSVYGQSVNISTVITNTDSPVIADFNTLINLPELLYLEANAIALATTNITGSGAVSGNMIFNAVGAIPVTTVFDGDSFFNAATGTGLTQTVNKADTTLTLVSNINPVGIDNNVTFTAALSGNSPSTFIPTGEFLTFYDGATPVYSGNTVLSGGAAKLDYITSYSATGAYIISVKFGGDSNYNAASDASLEEDVMPSPPISNSLNLFIGGGPNISAALSLFTQGNISRFMGLFVRGAGHYFVDNNPDDGEQPQLDLFVSGPTEFFPDPEFTNVPLIINGPFAINSDGVPLFVQGEFGASVNLYVYGSPVIANAIPLFVGSSDSHASYITTLTRSLNLFIRRSQYAGAVGLYTWGHLPASSSTTLFVSGVSAKIGSITLAIPNTSFPVLNSQELFVSGF